MAFALAIAGPTSHAQELVPRVRFEYRAPRDCPREREFLADVREKAAFELASSASSAARTFTVVLTRSTAARSSRYHGELHARAADGSESTREISGAECADVSEAIAVIIAIELAPEGRPENRSAPADLAVRTPAARIPEHATPMSVPRLPASRTWEWGGVATVALSSGLASGVSPEARLSLALRRAYAGVFSPEFRLAVAYADGNRQAGANGSVELRALGLGLEACPLRARLSPSIWLEPCAATRLAFRTATGGPPSNPTVETSRALWADVGGLARAAFSVSDSIWLELSAEAFAPLIRERFYAFSSELTVYQVPRVGLRLAAGIGVAF